MRISKMHTSSLVIIALLVSCLRQTGETIHVFEIKEIVLTAENQYENPYTAVDCWVDLKGPGFNKRVYGFWDGGQIFKVRLAATNPGEWSWVSGADPSADAGLNGQSGSFNAINWTEKEKKANNNRRGFIRATPNGHALQYADGTPFFFIGDTWWSAPTWRYPLTGKTPDPNWVPGPDGLSFENVVHYRQKQGYNMLAMIACYPNWAADNHPAVVVDDKGIGIRQPWEKFGTPTAKDMHDESGNLPFALKDGGPMADFDQIIPAYFQSLDKKMDHLSSVGFVPFMETVRRDHGPSWKAYFDWPGSFVRYIHYIASRYGAYNFILSPIHLDWIPPVHSLSGDEFNEAVVAWYDKYGPMPYGQPVTSLINGATHITYGAGEKVPWLTMHSVGNSPRNHGFYPWLEEQFHLDPPKPTANLEAYYPGWDQYAVTIVAGERAERNSDRDNYFGRTQAWGSVFSGALSGHIYGTGAYDGTTVGEEEGARPFIWEALKYPAGEQVGYLRKFLESEGAVYQDLGLASENLHPRNSSGSFPNGLDGWAFMMWLPDKSLAMLYFENKCETPQISNLFPQKEYLLNWFDPISGKWLEDSLILSTNDTGVLSINNFPDGGKISTRDWSLKMLLIE
jgi:hypothetical protein